jgi:hypothetical protein
MNIKTVYITYAVGAIVTHNVVGRLSRTVKNVRRDREFKKIEANFKVVEESP